MEVPNLTGTEVIQSTLNKDLLPELPDIDQCRVEIAQKIIDGGSCKVHKTTRSGFSTSAELAAVGAGVKILFIAPTNRIIDETVHSTQASAILLRLHQISLVLSWKI
jgi:hypothetical protein